MNPVNQALFRRLLGTSQEKWTRKKTATQTNQVLAANFGSKKKVRVLGEQNDGTLTILSEEDRENHMHVLGAPGTGKSKFLELLIRGDIDRGQGACLLDPSANGQTVKDILAYCAHKGFEKVCLINPEDFEVFDAIPSFNPIKYGAPTEVSIGNIMDSMHVLWSESFEDKKRTERYARMMLSILERTHHVLPDVEYFIDQKKAVEREIIWKNIPTDDPAKSELRDAVKSNKFEPITNRFSVFTDHLLKKVFARNALNFQRMVREGWLILVNLDPEPVWGMQQLQQRLLGTLVINEITYAIGRLRHRGWKGTFNLYIDEVGDYATPKLSFILDKKRKAGLRLILAHQRFGQIQDKDVLSSIRGSAKAKVLFQTPSEQDRSVMMKDMGYGGDLADREVLHALRNLKKQQAAISIHGEPRFTTIADVPSYPQKPGRMKSFKEKLYSYEWFDTPHNINQKLNARFKSTKSVLSFSRKGTLVDASKPRSTSEDNRGSEERAVPDNQPGSQPLLLSKKRRNVSPSGGDKKEE